MGLPRKPTAPLWCLMLWLVAGSGCTVSIQPWSRATPAAPAESAETNQPGMAPPAFQGPMPRPLPASFQSGMGNESFVRLNKLYNEADDHRTALLAQVQALQKQVRERDQNLRLATAEMEDSSTKIKHTRDDLRRWETELNEVRQRVQRLEDSRKEVALLLQDILEYLNRSQEPAKLPKLERTQK